jgi:hypothetical protein
MCLPQTTHTSFCLSRKTTSSTSRRTQEVSTAALVATRLAAIDGVDCIVTGLGKPPTEFKGAAPQTFVRALPFLHFRSKYHFLVEVPNHIQLRSRVPHLKRSAAHSHFYISVRNIVFW